MLVRRTGAGARMAIALTYERENNWESAERELYGLVADYPDTLVSLQAPMRVATHYMNAGEREEAQKRFLQAIVHYSAVIQQNPFSELAVQSQENIAFSLVHLGRWQEAANALHTLVDTYPRSQRVPPSLMTLASLYRSIFNNPRQAAAIYETVIRRYPRHQLAAAARRELDLLRSAAEEKQDEE